MPANANLHKAKDTRNDEFYTQYDDVASELQYYADYFKDKVVYCNCDRPELSAFWKYFHMYFNTLNLKKLIATYYDPEHTVYKTEYAGGNDSDINAGISNAGYIQYKDWGFVPANSSPQSDPLPFP